MNWLDSLLLGIQRITAGGATKSVKPELEFSGDCSVTETDDKLIVSIAGGSGGTGKDAFTTTTEAFSMPSAASPVTVGVKDNSAFFVGEIVQVAGAGFMRVEAVGTSVTTLTLANLADGTHYATNIEAGSTIASGALVTASGRQGIDGVDGAHSFATTTAVFAMPTSDADPAATVPVDSATALAVGEIVQVIEPSTGMAFMRVTAVSGNNVSLLNLRNIYTGTYSDNLSDGSDMPIGTLIIPSGPQGPRGLQGVTGTAGAGAWSALTAGTDFSTTAASSSSITMLVDKTATIKPGYAIRVVDGGTTKWGVVSSVSSGSIGFVGPALTLTAGAITAVSWADNTRVQSFKILVDGAFAYAASSTLLATYCRNPWSWLGGPARVAFFRVRSAAQSATAPKVTLTIGGTSICSDNSNAGPAVTSSWSAGTLVTANLALTMQATIELVTTQGATTNTLDSDLAVDLLVVRE